MGTANLGSRRLKYLCLGNFLSVTLDKGSSHSAITHVDHGTLEMSAYKGMFVMIKGQHLDFSSLPPLGESWGFNSGSQTW